MGKRLQIDELWKDQILSSLDGLEYGVVQIIVHDGKIVQIERTERKRFDSIAQLSERTFPKESEEENRGT
ncbi:MAG: hypothetical protein JWN30_2341 [Bacilli bacterium]|nr:hypothetical protein [Bacilli bacterium]